MTRRSRIHVSNGLYHVVHRSNGARPIFARLDDYVEFERIFSRTLKQYNARVHAYCWLPDAIHCAIQVDTAPLSDIMRSLASRYVQRYLRRHEPLFRGRYRATLFDPDYLPDLIRYIHRASIPEGQTEISDDFPWSSHRAYLGQSRVPWLTTTAVLRRFSPNPDRAVERYREFMQESVDTSRFNGFDSRSRDTRVVGGALFLCSLPRHLQIYRGTMTLQDVIGAVLRQQGLTHEELFSGSSERRVVLARALIAFHATERRIATYAEVMRVLGRTGLKQAVRRLSAPGAPNAHLFDMKALYNAGPLLPVLAHNVGTRGGAARSLRVDRTVNTQ